MKCTQLLTRKLDHSVASIAGKNLLVSIILTDTYGKRWDWVKHLHVTRVTESSTKEVIYKTTRPHIQTRRDIVAKSAGRCLDTVQDCLDTKLLNMSNKRH